MPIRKIGLVGRTYRHVQRYRQILGVLIRYGFDDLVDNLEIERYLDIGLRMVSRRRRERIEKLSRPQRLRLALEELGPTFVKMGQVLSTRVDVLPADFVQELAGLQDSVPPFGFAEVKSTIEQQLHRPLEEAFEQFDEPPLAAASLGQVHRARLHDRQEAIVKVQRPRIKETIVVDLEILLHLATLMERHVEGWELHRPTAVVEEFARTLERELDYTVEAAHIERFGRQFTREVTIYVPQVYRELTTARVLTMEYVDGIKVSDLERLDREGYDRQEIARRGADLIMEQVFVHGFFHADPHPGNVLVLPGNVICYVDFGMMGRIDRANREDFADLAIGVVRRDEAAVTVALLKLTLWDTEPERGALAGDVTELVDQFAYQPLKDLELAELLQQFLELAARHQLRIPPDLFLMLKALSTVEGVGQMLDPEFDVVAHAAPFLRRVQMARLHPRRIVGDMASSATELARLLADLPREAHAALRHLRDGALTVRLEDRGLSSALATLDRVTNRLAFAIVLGSLVIGSSVIVLAGVPPKWHDIPIIGLVGFLVAAVMGFGLLVSIVRHGRM